MYALRNKVVVVFRLFVFLLVLKGKQFRRMHTVQHRDASNVFHVRIFPFFCLINFGKFVGDLERSKMDFHDGVNFRYLNKFWCFRHDLRPSPSPRTERITSGKKYERDLGKRDNIQSNLKQRISARQSIFKPCIVCSPIIAKNHKMTPGLYHVKLPEQRRSHDLRHKTRCLELCMRKKSEKLVIHLVCTVHGKIRSQSDCRQ